MLRSGGWLTGDRVLAYGGATLILSIALLGAWGWATSGFTANTTVRPGIDFTVFWSGSHAMLHGAPATVYDYPAFSRAEAAQLGAYVNRSFLPWVYPPTLLVLVTPLALLPYVPSLLLFCALGLVAYAKSVGALCGLRDRLMKPRLASSFVILSFPGVLVASVIGQNALLTAACAALAIRLLAKRPALAGLCISLLAVKPQMALLFPLLLVATRAWRACFAAAAGTLVFAAASVAICGIASVPAFLSGATMLRELVLEQGTQYWLASPAPFSAMRLAGASLHAAYAVQIGVGVLAAAAALEVWLRTSDTRLRAAAFAVATLLATPYLWHYELAWLGIALFGVLACALDTGWLPGEQPVFVAGWLLPFFEFFNRAARFPQFGPVVLLAVLLIVVRRARTMPGVAR
ncbi:glycosyltransferase family 87 protein [Burkholderia thailandensis]|nr:glycosyltransferase family 87 protein [Burkholderia thailandensis]AHI76805.1 hypothetical protein BTQ_5551 [Burkholderia thailandensis 2002721723]AHI80655.1 hypothetical protein BTJ_4207 [Burkholderia thailandensis E444]AIC90217.1 hypothetical protein BTRA_4942 [Burkholderia thailandensis USAMRU Malaysia \